MGRPCKATIPQGRGDPACVCPYRKSVMGFRRTWPADTPGYRRLVTASGLALVFAADDRFARPMAVAMHSALRRLSSGITTELYVLDNGISSASRERLQRAVQSAAGKTISWIPVPAERLVDHLGAAHLTSTAYARLLIPDLLPAHVRRVIYLDGDVLVRRDLSPLFHVELGDAPVAAVRDFAIGSTTHDWSGVRESAVPRPYFNSGLLVIDVARWRSMEV